MTAKVILGANPPQPSARDRSPRRRVQLRAEASTTTGIYALQLRNLSCTGAMAEGEKIPPKGRDLVLQIRNMEMFCTVVWCNEERCGLKFDEPLPQPLVLALSQIVADGRDEEREAMIAAKAWVCPEGRRAFLD